MYIYIFKVWITFFAVLVVMTLISTWLLGITQKTIASNINDSNQHKSHTMTIFSNELSNRAFAVVANVTGHTGICILIINLSNNMIQYFKTRFYILYQQKVRGPPLLQTNYFTGSC